MYCRNAKNVVNRTINYSREARDHTGDELLSAGRLATDGSQCSQADEWSHGIIAYAMHEIYTYHEQTPK